MIMKSVVSYFILIVFHVECYEWNSTSHSNIIVIIENRLNTDYFIFHFQEAIKKKNHKSRSLFKKRQFGNSSVSHGACISNLLYRRLYMWRGPVIYLLPLQSVSGWGAASLWAWSSCKSSVLIYQICLPACHCVIEAHRSTMNESSVRKAPGTN